MVSTQSSLCTYYGGSLVASYAQNMEFAWQAAPSLIPSARLKFPPGNTARSCIPAALVHKKAWMPRRPLEYPTTSPLLLIALASLEVSPASVPRSRTLPVFVQRTARSSAALADVPVTSSTSCPWPAELGSGARERCDPNFFSRSSCNAFRSYLPIHLQFPLGIFSWRLTERRRFECRIADDGKVKWCHKAVNE